LGILDTSSPVAQVLKAGDVVVQINGKMVGGMSDIANLGAADSVEMVSYTTYESNQRFFYFHINSSHLEPLPY
jgi:C-terminal processing protease CtpA/Prc